MQSKMKIFAMKSDDNTYIGADNRSIMLQIFSFFLEAVYPVGVTEV